MLRDSRTGSLSKTNPFGVAADADSAAPPEQPRPIAQVDDSHDFRPDRAASNPFAAAPAAQPQAHPTTAAPPPTNPFLQATTATRQKLLAGEITQAEADKIDAVNAAAAATSPVDIIGPGLSADTAGSSSRPHASVASGSGSGSGSTRGRPPRTTPTANIQESIVFALDLSEAMDAPTSNFKKGEVGLTVLQSVQSAITAFVHTKARMNKYHRFGLMIIGVAPMWLLEWTSDPQQLAGMVAQLATQGPFAAMSFDALLKDVASKLDIARLQRPDMICRVVLVHGRRETPTFMGEPASNVLLRSAGFYIDFLHVYNPKTDEQHARAFLQLCDNEFVNPHFYRMKVPTDSKAIMACMAMLHAHPLQRIDQLSMCHSLERKEADLL